MQPFHINDSTKNIPIPGRLQYMKRLIEKGESFISRLRWKLFFIQNPSNDGENKENFGFNSTKSAPSIKEMNGENVHTNINRQEPSE